MAIPKKVLNRFELEKNGVMPFDKKLSDMGEMLFFSQVGGHAEDALFQILKDKTSDIENCGFCYWAQGNFVKKDRINDIVEKFISGKFAPKPKYVIMPISDNKFDDNSTSSNEKPTYAQTELWQTNSAVLTKTANSEDMASRYSNMRIVTAGNAPCLCFKLKKIYYLDALLDDLSLNGLYSKLLTLLTNKDDGASMSDDIGHWFETRDKKREGLNTQGSNFCVRVKPDDSLGSLRLREIARKGQTKNKVNCLIGELTDDICELLSR